MRRAAQTMIHYPIDLPTDYDMGVIRDRVRTRGHALDDRAGLWFKAYCIREVGVHGSAHNQYAPFYVWHDARAAAEFLWGGGGFAGIVRDFARPRVDTWLPVTVAEGAAPHSAVTFAQLRTEALPGGEDLTAAAARLRERAEASAHEPGVHLACAGIDPSRWRSVELLTHADEQAPPVGADWTTYTVLHVSQPA